MPTADSPAVHGVMVGERQQERQVRNYPAKSRLMITFPEAKEIVRAAGEKDWTVGTYQIEDDGWEDATHYLVVRGTAEDDPNLVIVPGGVPLVSMETGEIEYVATHTEWDRLDAMWSVRLVIA
jgi:hypothetical protein